jgi:group I intron endonuclease
MEVKTMTQGIYKLVFNGTDKVYIGQSVNIETRYTTHLNELRNKSHSRKLQQAYAEYGIPELCILEENVFDNLDDLEEYYIKQYSSVSHGFNSSSKASGGVSLGENNGRSKYSNEQIIEAVQLMVEFPDISLKVLSDNIGISWDTLKQIARGSQYKWLEDTIPETYDKLISLKGTRFSTSNSAKGKNKEYPTVLSPLGTLHKIENCKIFCDIHNLQQSNLVQVLNGNRLSHKGWKLAPK